ncbi:MAG: DegT/DnrJ/EryC1/StrS family aminotransferase [Marmoricola sp.]
MSADGVPFSRPLVTADAQAAGCRALASGWLTTGPECAAFEAEFAAWLGAEHAVTVSSCTEAIELSLRAMHLRPASRVLVPAITFCGVAGAVRHAGHVPVLADVDPGSAMVSPVTAHQAARAVGGVDAMVVLHYAGEPAPVEELAAAAGVPRTRVVEDAAHAVGSWTGGQRVGSRSYAACFSFYATKNLPIGEGGMVATDDPEIADRIRCARLHGMSHDAWRRYAPGGSWRYDVVEEGLKANLTEMAAAVGRVQLQYVDRWQDRRAEIAAAYQSLLSEVVGLELPDVPVGARHAWHLYVVRVTRRSGITRDELSDRLARQGIGTSVHFIPLHHLTQVRKTASVPRPLEGAERVFHELLSLPIYPALTDDEVDRVCSSVATALAPLERREVIA